MSMQTSKSDRFDLDKQIGFVMEGKFLPENEIKMVCEKVN
jgi:hypothetical protein